MPQLNLSAVSQYVEENIGKFHESRLDKVKEVKLKEVLKAKNPYLYKAKNISKASELIDNITSAYISSSEETAFGNWLERLAIFINHSVYGGRKGGIEGIDLDFDRDDKRYLVAIKSGPKWANDSQIKKLIDQFDTARGRLNTSGSIVNIVCVNGCCYGKSTPRNIYKKKGNYYKYCGQKFWELISGESDLYLNLINPLSKKAEEKNEEFKVSYGNLINKFTKEFLEDFCNAEGMIDWDKLVKFNSEFISNESKEERQETSQAL